MFARTILAVAVLAAGVAQAGDAQKGKQDFVQCQVCHTAQKGGANGLGPNLFGVAGRRAASLAGFAYSDGLKKSGIVWSDDKLKAWVSGPSKVVPGTKMTFAGISDAGKRDDLIAYLDTLK